MKKYCNKAVYNSTREICFPEVTYPDSTRRIKQYRSNLEQGFRVNNIAAFEELRDQKNNNFSLNYLTNSSLLTDLIELPTKATGLEVITTPLRFFAPEDTVEKRNLYIYKPDGDKSLTQRAVGLEDINRAIKNNFYFELEILNDYFLRIRHNDGSNYFYMHWDEALNKFVFLRGEAEIDKLVETSDMFRYNIDEFGRMHLFKCTDEKLFVMSASETDIIMEQIKPDSRFSATGANTIAINYNFININNSQNNDFVNYEVNKFNTLTINPLKSLFNQKGQYLFHCEYNSQDLKKCSLEFNFFTLDTSRSEYGFIKRGTNTLDSFDSFPTFTYRKYNTLDTGGDEEGGHDKMSLIYTFFDKDIYIESGRTTAFTAPSSIYPFEKLNINDTTFTKNGAFSGPSPALSDKFYVKQNQPGHYQNGRYLCTWLSASSPLQPAVWVDRYYYPDAASKFDALGEIPRYVTSFTDNADQDVTYSDRLRQDTAGIKFFDKKSDAVITPNSLLKYERVGISDINNIISSSMPLASGFDNYHYQVLQRDIDNTANRSLGKITEDFCVESSQKELLFDGTFYTKLSVYEDINKTKEFSLSFDADIDTDTQYGYKIMGNSVGSGFGVFQDRTITPFLHIVNKNVLRIYNTDATLLNTITFQSTIEDGDENIKDIFRFAALEDFIVVSESDNFTFMYRVDAKGNKKRLEIDSSGIYGYINTYMAVDHILFLLPLNRIKKLNIYTLELTEYTLDDDLVEEFDEYKDSAGLAYYEGVIEYNNKIYLLPACVHQPKWCGDDIIFYTVRSTNTEQKQYALIKHDLRRNEAITFLTSDCPISDLIVTNREPVKTIVIAIGNTTREYNTNGVFINAVNYDEQLDFGLVEGDDTEIQDLQGELNTGDVITSEIIALDIVNEYVQGGVGNFSELVLFANSDNSVTLNAPTGASVPFEGVTAEGLVVTPITNYNTLNHIYSNKTLDFKITLTNKYNSEDVLNRVIEFDPARVDKGRHTFTFNFDSMLGVAALFVDGAFYEDIRFERGKYKIHNIFNDEFYVGTAGFANGLDLATYLKQPGYYFINNLKVENFYINNKTLNNTEIFALSLRDKKIDDLVLSIPHGQRNNKATIERFYKLGRHNASKAIDVVINNFRIEDTKLQSQIKINLLQDFQTILPVGVKVNNITFSN